MYDYTHNPERFAAFYVQQQAFTAVLAQHPAIVRDWLSARRVPQRCSQRIPEPTQWRTARLTAVRQRQLKSILDQGGDLAAWLLLCLPLSSLFEIADRHPPDSESVRRSTDLVVAREVLFLANFGLAKIAAAQSRPEEFDDRLSAACSGLLDAIDRYVPGPGSASFSYFAAYWIRYHVGRYVQKHGCVVSFPIHQQRLYQKFGQSRFDRPSVFSLQAPVSVQPDGDACQYELADPAPQPEEVLDGSEIAGRLAGWLRRSVPPATRVMLAAANSVGNFPEAAGEYVDHLCEIARERLRNLAQGAVCPPCLSTRTCSPPGVGSLPTST